MPKKPRIFTKTLYTYATPQNNRWVRAEAKRLGTSYSNLLNIFIDFSRRNLTLSSASMEKRRAKKAA